METAFLLALHAHASSGLDRVFLLSHQLGTYWFLVPTTLIIALGHRLRGERRLALMWIALGVSTVLLFEGLKHLTDRARPDLWPRLAVWPPLPGANLLSFPSGHALASATLFPVLAFVLARGRGRAARRGAMALGALVAFWIGFGRLYLGVHWPSDVLAGWALGALQALVAIRWVSGQAAADGLGPQGRG